MLRCTSGRVSVWNLVSKREDWKVTTANERPVVGVAQIAHNKIISQGRGGQMEVWDIGAQEKLNLFNVDDPRFCKLSVLRQDTGSHDTGSHDRLAVASSEFGQVNIYETSIGKLVTTLKVTKPSTKGTCMCVHYYNNHILAGFEDGSVVLFDCRNCKPVSELKVHSEPVMCLHCIDNGLGVTGSADDVVSVLMINETLTLTHKYNISLHNKGTSSVAIRHDRRIITTGGWDGRLNLFGCKKGKPLATLNYHTENITSLDYSSSSNSELNKIIACGSRDGRISLWNLYQHV
ncbi:uncharacterized protein [Dysidea avara]|uniref:uncharacterized protein isoform X2 n=1 Tax=Dysidea avara TaxID=196820 RepID=UPI003316DC30